jgi:hypothetical protein
VTRVTYPRDRIRILLLENIHPAAVERLSGQGYTVETAPGALGESELAERLAGVHVLGVRSKTAVTAEALRGADRLLAVGAFCIGVNHIDLEACARRGAAVFNAPVLEHPIGGGAGGRRDHRPASGPVRAQRGHARRPLDKVGEGRV